MAGRSSGNDMVSQERRYIAYYYKLYAKYSRALEWHSRGQRFDPAYLHHFGEPKMKARFGNKTSFYFHTGRSAHQMLFCVVLFRAF